MDKVIKRVYYTTSTVYTIIRIVKSLWQLYHSDHDVSSLFAVNFEKTVLYTCVVGLALHVAYHQLWPKAIEHDREQESTDHEQPIQEPRVPLQSKYERDLSTYEGDPPVFVPSDQNWMSDSYRQDPAQSNGHLYEQSRDQHRTLNSTGSGNLRRSIVDTAFSPNT